MRSKKTYNRYSFPPFLLIDIMYEDFFGPRDAVLQDQQKHYPSRRDRVNNNKSSQRENLELENDDDGYYDMPNDDSTNSSADKADEDEDAMNEDGSSVDNDSSSNPLASQSNSSNKTKNLFDDDDTSPSGEQQELSTFEKQQQKLSKAISALEEDAVAAKPWTLKGEAQAKDRPQNALLEEDLEVDYAAKPVPVITEETTQTLEEIIKARILDSLFDDVVRVAPREGTAFDPNRRIELDGTKSSVGLADVYESEYMRNQQQQAGGGSGVATEKDSKLQAVHEEIESLFKNLCLQLDALSNWHYTPAPPTAEITVLPTSNNNTTPAIAMEEALPAAVSDASLLAPRDVYDGKIAKSAAEMTTADKTRLRVAARKRVGKDKADKEAVLAAKEAARAVKMGGVAALDRTKSAAGTKSAMKTLAGMSNVTFVNEGATMGRLIAGSGIGNKGRGGKNKKGGGKSGGGGGEASVVSNDASKRSKSSSSVTANPNMMRL